MCSVGDRGQCWDLAARLHRCGGRISHNLLRVRTTIGCSEAQLKPSDHDLDATLLPSAPPAVDALIGEAPDCRRCEAFKDSVTSHMTGVWEATPYHRDVRRHKVHELMHIIEGTVQLSQPDGQTVTVAPGETVFVPKGTLCGWRSESVIRKIFVVND